ncbi:AAA family ATPase [Sedimentibacter hydroxybenzoicus DSM 7310]|uniref:AAA family ATPase n=1 Tax=Sedimentibacter hydroxybenzoicus DSM 7310 TaxID=1123245 RepID=A0A974BHR2_SEDHY|nr:AAA family ATPase [Sedimentibacter hydroxybenzoicus]NYB73383.1 AAA family ATPase [Sedimentibacter hydroxybenzoicus DSM 7310]
MIEKIKIENFKCIEGSFELSLKQGINILVGNNEAGKSTILEAIHMALSGIFRGRTVKGNLTQYLFNYNVVNKYLDEVNKGSAPEAPYILIELYMNGSIPMLEGDKFTDKSRTARTSGIALKIALDEKYSEEYESLIKAGELASLPIEYYDVEWYAFSRRDLTSRSIPFKSSFIDVGFSKFQNGSDIYISRIIQNILETEEKIKVAQAYRKIKETFSNDTAISNINSKITGISKLSSKEIELTVDLGARSTWDGSLITQLDNIPFDFIGKGEQSVVKIDLALSNKKSESSSVILIEEPECHISHSRLNQLLKSIKSNYDDKQIIISTHSSFVSNKLGLDNLILLSQQKTIHFNELKSKEFFEKISGYDTLRLILCKKAILVEGDSDELIVQRAYMDAHNGRLPIEDNVEVISVGTSFLRFLEIAEHLNIPVRVVTDNDGSISSLEKKYKNYIGVNKKINIDICYDNVEHTGILKLGKDEKPFNYNTLEPLLLKENSLVFFNSIFGMEYPDENDLHKYMKNHKTECALKIFSSKESIKYPEYIKKAIR